MDIKFKNNLEDNTMSMTVAVKKREFLNQEHIIFGWQGAEKALAEYECPSTHTLGECHNQFKKINNDYDQSCEQTWTFDLLLKESALSKAAKKPVRKKTTVKK
tara:strand:- start:221 stop:529 length:309 start_codon:yes stop_codon:yes gene_type:complete